ncbi:MAG: hypothetical protein ACLFQB_14330 [Chitinispirillaceae bacterium]
MKSRLLVLIMTVSFLHYGCGVSVVEEGGGATETVNCQVVSSGGEPDSGAVVLLVDAGNWFEKRQNGSSVVLDSAVTGRDGYFTFEYDTSYTCNLQVNTTDEAAFISDIDNYMEDTSSLQTIVLRPAAQISGVLNSESTVTNVELFGTAYFSSVQENRFAFSDLAWGNYPMLLLTEENVYIFENTAAVPQEEQMEINVDVREQSILVDDFDGDFQLYHPSKLGLITGGNWYVYDDSKEADSNTSFISVETSGQDAFEEKSLSAEAVLGDAAKYPFTGLGVNVLSQGQNCDFSTVNSISFWARGNCTVYFSVETEIVDQINWSPHFGMQIELTDTWTEYTVQMDNIAVPPSSEAAKQGLGWDDVKHTVKRIEFDLPYGENTLGDTLRFELDDIYMNGALIEELLP